MKKRLPPSAPGAFKPGMKDGRPVAVRMDIEVDFHIY
jgi:hypothetical protein